MDRAERRRRIKEYSKELEFIFRHTEYLSFLDTREFLLPKEELDLLVADAHEDKVLQEKFNLAKDLYARVDALTTWIRKLKEPKKEEHLEYSANKSPHPHTELS